jgi:cytochrome c oxidase subunit 2
MLLATAAWASAAPSAKQELATAFAKTPDPERGARLYINCVSCHGSDGSGQSAGTTPRIGGQHYRVLVRQLVDFRRGKRWDFQMEGVTKSHNAIPELQDIADVAWHVSQLDRAGSRGVGDGQNTEVGGAIYVEKCASCHGARAEGDDAREVPMLAGQHAGYLSRQMYNAVDGRRIPMMRSHQKLLEPLAFEEIRGVADYLSRIDAPAR